MLVTTTLYSTTCPTVAVSSKVVNSARRALDFLLLQDRERRVVDDHLVGVFRQRLSAGVVAGDRRFVRPVALRVEVCLHVYVIVSPGAHAAAGGSTMSSHWGRRIFRT